MCDSTGVFVCELALTSKLHPFLTGLFSVEHIKVSFIYLKIFGPLWLKNRSSISYCGLMSVRKFKSVANYLTSVVWVTTWKTGIKLHVSIKTEFLWSIFLSYFPNYDSRLHRHKGGSRVQIRSVGNKFSPHTFQKKSNFRRKKEQKGRQGKWNLSNNTVDLTNKQKIQNKEVWKLHFMKKNCEALSMKKRCGIKETNLKAWEVCHCEMQELYCSQQHCLTVPQPVWPTMDF